MKKNMISLLFASLVTTPVWAQVVGYSEYNNLRLGAGVDMDHPDRAKANCVQKTATEWIDGTSPVATSFDLNVVESSSEFFRRMNFDLHANAAATIKAVSIDSQNSYQTIHKFLENKNSLNFALTAEFSFGRKGLGEETLKPEYEELLKAGKWQSVQARCGTHFVAEEVHRSKLMVLIHVKNTKTEDVRETILDIKNKLKVPKLNIASADLNVQYREFIRRLDKLGSVEVKILATGGQGSEALAAFSNEVVIDDFQSIKNAAAKYFKTFTAETSPTYAYVLKPLNIFEDAEQIRERQQHWDDLQDIATWLGEQQPLLEEMQGMQSQVSNALYVTYYEPRWRQLKSQMADVRVRANDCIENFNCDNLPVLRPFVVSVPSRPVNAAGLNVQCGYMPLPNMNMSVLSDVQVSLDLDSSFTKSLENVDLLRLDAQGEFKAVNFGQNQEQRIVNNLLDEETGRSRRFQALDDFSAGLMLGAGAQDSVQKAQDAFNEAFYSTYILKMKFTGGREFVQVLGAPSLKNCPVTVRN